MHAVVYRCEAMLEEFILISIELVGHHDHGNWISGRRGRAGESSPGPPLELGSELGSNKWKT